MEDKESKGKSEEHRRDEEKRPNHTGRPPNVPPEEPPGRDIRPRKPHGAPRTAIVTPAESKPTENACLRKSVGNMEICYRQFRYQFLDLLTPPVGVWNGTIQPLKTAGDVLKVLDDLAHHRVLHIVAGELRHHPECIASHCHHDWMEDLKDLDAAFEIETIYVGGREHPKSRVVARELPDNTPHRWGQDTICPFLASEGVWDFRKHTVVEYMDQVAIWVAKCLVWLQAGIWIGEQHPHQPMYHLSVIKPNQQCWCGSGRKYRKCHMQVDVKTRFRNS